MLIFWCPRLALLSVPKTASTALTASLEPHADMIIRHPPELKHSPVYRYNRFFRPMFEKPCKTHLETAALIRHPMSWLESWYRYRQRDDLDGHPNSTKGISFNDFLLAYLLPRERRPAYAEVGSQGRFLENPEGMLGVDHLYQFEAIETFLGFISNRVGKKIELEKVNMSPEGTLKADPSLMEMHRMKHEKDYIFWEKANS